MCIYICDICAHTCAYTYLRLHYQWVSSKASRYLFDVDRGKPWVWLARHDMLEFVAKEARRSHCYRRFLVPSYCQGSVGTGCSLRARNGDWGGPPRGSRAGLGSLSHPTAPAREQDSRGGTGDSRRPGHRAPPWGWAASPGWAMVARVGLALQGSGLGRALGRWRPAPLRGCWGMGETALEGWHGVLGHGQGAGRGARGDQGQSGLAVPSGPWQLPQENGLYPVSSHFNEKTSRLWIGWNSFHPL